MKTFVSIDIDFWNGLSPEHLERKLSRIVQKVMRQNIPITAVMNHQQMIHTVNRSGALQLKNVDLHSDLTDTTVNYFECGSWVAYVEWRKKGKYIWYHRHRVSDGECNGFNPIFSSHSIKKELTDWGKLSRRRVYQLPSFNSLFENCVGVSLCLSPEYSDYNFKPIFMKIVKKFKIPYKRGRLDESSYGIKRKPPAA